MSQRRIDPVAIIGGRGKTGRAVIAALSARGVTTRPLGRGELADPQTALAGCAAAYLIAPNMAGDEPALVESWLAASHRAGVRRVVYHSVCAPYAPSLPHHLGKAESEDLIRRSELDWTILQPCAYVQNFVPGLRASSPVVEVAYDVEQRFGLVDLRDVGEAAASVLLTREEVGATYELGGPALVSIRDVAHAAEKVLRCPVRLAQITTSAWAAGPGAGLEPREREWLQAMFGYYHKHGLPCGALPLRALLGREPHDVATTLRAELEFGE